MLTQPFLLQAALYNQYMKEKMLDERYSLQHNPYPHRYMDYPTGSEAHPFYYSFYYQARKSDRYNLVI